MKRILITIDELLLERLDHEAAVLGISRSALLGQMLAAALGEPVGLGAHAEVHAALDQLKDLFRGVDDEIDSTQVIREMRDSR
jgi:metal-responsive CopG/Arc/MetJ family transcriptional regulator